VSPFSTYVRQIESAVANGDATEHTHRPALKTLIEAMAPGVIATNEPKRIECGAPDFIVTRAHTPIGYVEAKDVGRPLSEVEKTDQMKRYFKGLGNLILTDYLEFRWYVDGSHRMTAKLASVGEGGQLRSKATGVAEVEQLFGQFIAAASPTVASAKSLASRMAGLAKIAKQVIAEALRLEPAGAVGVLHQQIDGFRKVLLHEMDEAEFADMYAQTIAYGLFAARCNAKPGERFDRRQAAWLLPKTNPFLRSVFNNIAGPDGEDHLDWVIDGLADLLNHTDVQSILADFGRHTRQEDPVVHFYETFLREYDPKMRELRGVYYTPEPVVSYIVRSVDLVLKRDFGCQYGLADESMVRRDATNSNTTDTTSAVAHRVQVLDPATGTGTFLYGVINKIAERFAKNRGAWPSYVASHLLPRIFGFELLMAPYAVAHLKLALLLKESGYDIEKDERLGIFMTNTLEEAARAGNSLFAQAVADEANAAYSIKKDASVMVVLGNPPYSGHSANKGSWISGLLHGSDSLTQRPTGSYFEVDGKPLKERNPKWLNDDYVKFIRFAQWRIEQTGYGVLAFITNHGYLDNPTFRGMRHSLMQTFDEIFVLDLHGNRKKNESAPGGGKDENVFDIQQGVAIGIFVKRSKPGIGELLAKVRHASMFGLRETKYKFLLDSDLERTEWATVAPSEPNWLFAPRRQDLAPEYDEGWDLKSAMPNHGPGMTTARDGFVIDFSADPLEVRVTFFRDSSSSDSELCANLGISEKLGWDIPRARQQLRAELNLRSHITPVMYRPFDRRVIFYHDSVVWRTVRATMHNMIGRDNLGLITTRQTRDDWDAFATTLPITHKALAAYDINTLFPLYLYPNGIAKNDLFDEVDLSTTPGGRRPNFSVHFIGEFVAKLGLAFTPDGRGDLISNFGPEDVFDYIYAVLHSPTYRERYTVFLRTDYPRLPITSRISLFTALCGLGHRLVRLHVLKEKSESPAMYPVPLPKGDSSRDIVERIRYAPPTSHAPGRVYINRSQFFEHVPPDVWNYHIGGYQVCDKWLKDRRGRRLDFDDLECYRNIVGTLDDTIRLMSDIDGTIATGGGWPIA
jgi:predicted helicase